MFFLRFMVGFIFALLMSVSWAKNHLISNHELNKNSSFSKENEEKNHPIKHEWGFKTRVRNIWNNGENALYLPFYTWHNRLMWSHDRAKTKNELPMGLGMIRSLEEDNDLYGLYAMVFLDSHKDVEPAIGYLHVKYKNIFKTDAKIGLGYTFVITARNDYAHYTPVPLILPEISIQYKNLRIITLYFPGIKKNTGNAALNILMIKFKF